MGIFFESISYDRLMSALDDLRLFCGINRKTRRGGRKMCADGKLSSQQFLRSIDSESLKTHFFLLLVVANRLSVDGSFIGIPNHVREAFSLLRFRFAGFFTFRVVDVANFRDVIAMVDRSERASDFPTESLACSQDCLV